MTQLPCLSLQDLNEFAVGKVSDERRRWVETHLDECAECQSTLESLDVSGDLLLWTLKQATSQDEFGHELGLREALRRIELIGIYGSALTRESTTCQEHLPVESIRDYRLLEKLGAGGMGTVYKALHTHLGKVVALKIVTASRNRDALAIARFKREMKAVGTLEHRNIVTAFDAGEFEGTHYLVMQFVEGMDLLRLGSRVSIPLADACEIIRQAAAGLQHAHEQGMVHRDLKPSNIMLTPDGCVKILDLGLALLSTTEEAQAEITSAGQLMGTLDYMAPEQCLTSHTVDIRADIYSLGATFYKLICGASLLVDHCHDTPLKKLAALTSTPVTSTRWEEKGIPPEFARVIERMMALSPHDRFSTPAEVVWSLATLSQGSDLRALLQKAIAAGNSSTATGDVNTLALRTATIDTTPALEHHEVRVAGAAEARDSLPKSPIAVKSVGRWPLSARTAVLAFVGLVTVGLVLGPISKLLISNGPMENSVVDGEPNSSTQSTTASSSVTEITNSPFDQLNRSNIPTNELAAAGNGDPAQAPAELVAVLGDSRLKHWAAVNDLAFTNHGGLVSVSDDSTLRLWDIGTGNMVRQLNTEGPSRCLDLSPDGKRVAANFQGASIRIWELATGQVLQTLTPRQEAGKEIWSLALSPNLDAPLLAASGQYSGLITVWNPKTGQELRTIPAHQNTIVGLSFSHDGKWLASAGSEDGTAKIWNVETGELLHTFDAREYVNGAAFTPDGDKLVVGSRRELTIWDTKTGELLRTFPGGVEHFMLTSEGDGVLFARAYQAWLLQFDSPDEPRTIGWNYMSLNAVAISSDGGHVATAGSGMPLPCSDGAIRLWDAKYGSELHPSHGHASAVNCVALRMNDQIPLIASGSTDHTVRLWDPATGRDLRTLSGPEHVNHVSFQPGSGNLVAGHDRYNVLWDPGTGEKQHEWTLNGWALSGAFTPDGNAFLGGCKDGNVYKWNTSSGEVLQTIDAAENDPNSAISALALDPTGKILALANYEREPFRHEFKLWDLAKGKELHSLDHGCPIRAAAFSPDGHRLATAGEWDNSAKIWDVETGELLQTLKGHQFWLCSVCFSPDGIRLATSARDGTIRIWDHWDSPAATTVRSIRLGPARGHVNQVVFSDDGRHLVTANGNGTVYILQAPRPAEKEAMDSIGQTPIDGRPRDQPSSVFDGLNRENLPVFLDADGQPLKLAPEIVAILGSSNPPKFRRPSPVALSPDGGTVAFMPSNYQVTLCDVASGLPRHTLAAAPDWGHANSLAFDLDGRVISTATRKPGIQRWDTETGQLLESINPPDTEAFAQIDIAIARSFLAMQFEGAKLPVVVWDLAMRREHRRMLLENTRAIALSPDGRLLATGGQRDDTGIMELWDLNTGDKIQEWRGRHAVGGLKFTGDAKKLFLIAGPTLVEWDVASGQELRHLTAGSNWIYRLAVTSDGRVAVTFHVVDCALRVWDIEQGTVQKTIPLPATDYEAFGGWAFTPDGRHLLAARNDGLVFVLRIH